MEAAVNTAILGSGNIGTDLMYKLGRSPILKLAWMIGVVPESEGLRLARERGVKTTHKGIEALLEHPDEFEIVFDATTAKAHRQHAELLKALGKIVVDLTPAAIGPPVVPLVNLGDYLQESDVNLTTCGGQATIPIVRAIHRAAPVEYAEIVATISSRSAGPGTRQNIDEFTETTARGLVQVAGAKTGKALIILNPADPPILMRNTIYCRIAKGADRGSVETSVGATVRAIQEYVPGYRLKAPPIFDDGLVTILLEVEGAGDYLPKYAGNLDIMTSAAVRVGEELAKARMASAESSQPRGLSATGVTH